MALLMSCMERVDGFWVHDLNPVLFSLTETLAVRWYGLAYVVGFILVWVFLWAAHRRGRSPISGPGVETFMFAMILGVLLGGRLGYFLFYETGAFFANPLIFFQFWQGGMASHGGFLGVLLAGLYCARKLHVRPLELGDLVATATPHGLLLGRLANFINGELWGKVTDVPWAVIFPTSAPPGTPVEWIAPRHPSQLYQAGLEGLVLLIYMHARFWLRGPSAVSSRPGHLMGEFLVGYSVMRVIGELFREPDASLILGLSRGTFYSLFLFLAGLAVIIYVRRQPLTNGQTG